MYCDGMMLWAILWCKVGVNGPNAKQQIRLCCHAVLSCCAVMLCCHAVLSCCAVMLFTKQMLCLKVPASVLE